MKSLSTLGRRLDALEARAAPPEPIEMLKRIVDRKRMADGLDHLVATAIARSGEPLRELPESEWVDLGLCPVTFTHRTVPFWKGN